MKRILCMLSMVAAIVAMTSCGGGNSPKSTKKASISLDELDDYYSVKSYSLESNAGELTPEQLGKVKGTLTLVVKRNKTPMEYKPSDVVDAEFYGDLSSSMYKVFMGDCDAAIKKMLKMEPDTEETFSLGFTGVDPYNQFNSDEQNQTARQNAYDAIAKPGCLDQILFEIMFKEEYEKLLKDLDDDDD